MPVKPAKPPRRLIIGTFFVMHAPLAHELQLGVALFAKEHGGIDLRRWDFKQWPKPAALEALGLDGIVAQMFSHFKRVSVKSCRIPIVNVSQQNRNYSIPLVGADEKGIGGAVGGYFLRRGYRNFAFCGQNWHDGSNLRYQGFVVAVEQAGFKVERLDLAPLPDEVTPFSNVRDYKRNLRWLRALPRPCAILCFNDDVAAMVIRNALDLGLRVPQDLAVMGVDNISFRTYQTPVSISTVDVGFAKIGYEATRELVRHLENREQPIEDRTVRAFKIISRGSTDTRAVDDELVCAAMEYIDENRTARLRVPDIARKVAVSRRVLERRFRAKSGFTIHQMMQESRLDTAKNLLVSTTLPFKEIATTAGFQNAQHLSVVFRSKLNTTPTAFRAAARGGEAKPPNLKFEI